MDDSHPLPTTIYEVFFDLPGAGHELVRNARHCSRRAHSLRGNQMTTEEELAYDCYVRAGLLMSDVSYWNSVTRTML